MRRQAADAHRPVGDAEADRRGRALPGRRRRGASDGVADCEIVDIGYAKQRDLALELPPTPLAAVMSNDQWEQVYAAPRRAGARSTAPRWSSSTRGAWPSARRATSASGWQGRGRRAPRQPRARKLRLDAEQRLKRGELKVLVATASLELGHRHRRRRPGLPARLAALDRHLPAARRPLGPRGRRRAQGAAVPADRATSWSNARRCSTACAAASSTRCASRTRRSTCWRSRSSPRSPAANGTRTSCSRWCAAPGPTRS